MEILLTFTGYHDPFVVSSLDGADESGPILTVLSERHFDKVCLFGTPKLSDRTEATRLAIGERHPAVEVEVLETPLSDPTNYLGILRQLRKHFRSVQRSHPNSVFSISVSSGTPHMHVSWFLLAASGEIPARILQATPPRFVHPGRSRVKEIDLTGEHFPTVTRLAIAESESDDDEQGAIANACRELGIVGEDPAFLKALRQAYIYAQYDDANVLLLGETGSGKEYFARFIHHCSRRSSLPLLAVNCGSIPENLVESYLFGHVKGAFTGATSNREGKFKTADRGVLFLDELGELPLSAQAKLLRVLDHGEIEPVGADRPQKVDVKFIAATNRNLRSMVESGMFREDLYQRLGSSVSIPALRERRIDIPRLAVHLLDHWNANHQRQRRLTAEAIRDLSAYSWPGNVRELANVIRESAMLAAGTIIRPDDLKYDGIGGGRKLAAVPEPEDGFDLISFLDDQKDSLIHRALERSGGVQSRAARLLGVTPQAVSQYLKRADVNRNLRKSSTDV